MGRDTIQLETAVSTISQEYLLEFTSEYGISEDVHPEFPGPKDMIVDFPEDKVGVYTKFFEFANFRIPLSQFLFDILGHYQIHLSQLSVIGAAKVSHFEINYMDLFNLISAPNPSKVKTGLRPRVAHELPLLTATASRVIDMEDPDAATESSGKPSAIEKSPLDFDNENPASQMTEGKGPEDQAQETVAPEIPLPGNMPGAGTASESTRGGKSLPTMGLATRATFIIPADTKGVNDPDPLSYAEPQPHPEQSITQSYEILIGNVATMEEQDTRSVESAGSGKSTSSPSMVGSPGEIYQPGWGVTNSCRLDTPDACQDVAMGSQLRLRFEQEVRLLKKARAQIARRDQRIQTLLEAETDMKKAAETKNVDLTKELESLRTQFLNLQLPSRSFKKYEDDRVEKRCAEMDARLDALSIYFDDELYPHMLIAIAGRRCAIGHGLRLAVMKCAESIELRSDGVPVSVPTIALQGLAILLADAATQTETSEDDASSRFLRSKSLPPMYNLDWP
nr:transposase (putative), gypsy type [Tanacetum cinerariifolium]